MSNVTGTAFIVAEFRAEENQEIAPLYTDNVVKIWLNEETKEIAAKIAQNSPAAKEMVKLRTKYFDDVLSNQILGGCKQVVILGSGLDTRAARINGEKATYFEIEDRATLQLKEETLKANKITANVRYIPGDYVKDGLISLLKQSEFDFDIQTYFLWEGNTTLLAKKDVIFVLEQIRDNVKSFRLSFDYMSEKVILRTTGYQDINDYIDKYESMYAPWITGFDQIASLAEELNLKLIENFSTADLHAQYRPLSSLESNLFKFYFVCTLENSVGCVSRDIRLT
ncbi:MAG: class I SAM-dependent methyltransferase [Microcoleus sp. PH2017_10_PVI_O_A]|nr:class I SAM-dependent methyltransferase [Microcoleus sp. PH2017_10_PVI_O_A]MCC3458387.1 class I SAM-dependent methyltransferase [Microcoleus sp. PH2017_11_PCY_U_A]MCC3476725.1 class I SAM-dependent methyltransferase [Microcoleus sp. PH2017_12_PCY_D_A]MCC3526864.1 class I SAM-dependent methyltransferase [Microcoleus sp. PH2017_21_RUC_O_A]MCC3539127.1 class I SAM-dependent methyltransferase [Microcoleus sp. PH2017_22_RUC_O_B]MCC3557847.1 class I SAM-dependent methyltransferase [Microcoleus sp